MVHFGGFLKTWSLLSSSVTRQVTLMKTKIATFWAIFKQIEAARKREIRILIFFRPKKIRQMEVSK